MHFAKHTEYTHTEYAKLMCFEPPRSMRYEITS